MLRTCFEYFGQATSDRNCTLSNSCHRKSRGYWKAKNCIRAHLCSTAESECWLRGLCSSSPPEPRAPGCPRSCASSSTHPQLDTPGPSASGEFPRSVTVLLSPAEVPGAGMPGCGSWGGCAQAGAVEQEGGSAGHGAVAAVTWGCTQLLSPAGTAGLGPALFQGKHGMEPPISHSDLAQGCWQGPVPSPGCCGWEEEGLHPCQLSVSPAAWGSR